MHSSSIELPRSATGALRSATSDAAPSSARAAFLVRPPYNRMEYHGSLDALVASHRIPGAIAGLRVRGGMTWEALQPLIVALRAQLPAASVVLVIAEGSPADLLLSARATRAGVRAILLEHEPLADGLRRALTCRDTLADDVVDWLVLRRLRLTPMISSLIREIFQHAPTTPDLSTLLGRIGMAESSARFRLHKRLLPTPSRWFQAARALHTVLRIQAEPRTSLLRIALELGYADHSALSQLVYRSFRVRPGAIRGTLGWEWLMHRWLRAIPDAARTGAPAVTQPPFPHPRAHRPN